MAKVHDKFVIELAEVIKGYGNDPDVDDPFRLSEFYRFYELPEIAVSANHFKTMIPLEVVEKNAQPGWIPFGAPMNSGQHYLVTLRQKFEGEETYRVRIMRLHEGHWLYPHHFPEWINDEMEQEVVAWMSLPEPWEGDKDAR